MKTISISGLHELDAAAEKILDEFTDVNVYAIKGKMGAGKTTFIKSVCKVLGVDEVVSSPTFALVNEYFDGVGESVFHFDFYRIKKLDEVYDIGYEEYFFSHSYCFIEWPEMITELLPEKYVYILIEESEDGSRIISYSLINN